MILRNRWLAAWVVLVGVAIAAPVFAQQGYVALSADVNQTALKPGGEAVVAVVMQIKAGFHSQSHAPRNENDIALVIAPAEPAPAGITFGAVSYPPGHDETYEGGLEANVYSGKVVFFVPVTVAAGANDGPVTLSGTIRYQVCDDKGICFAPKTSPWSVATTVSAAGGTARSAELFAAYKPGVPPIPGRVSTAPATTRAAQSSAGAPPVVVDEDQTQWNVLTAFGFAFLAGVLFNIVPCVLPVLPIKVMGFAEVAQHDRGKTVLLATIFGAGIVSVFAVLSVLILVMKRITWGQQYSNPYFAWGMVIVLLLLSLWLFGLLNVNLPGKLYAFQPRHDTYMGNYFLGVMTAVLSTPCTGPLFPPLLKWASDHPTSVGVPVMIMVGVGMAFPYVVLSAFPEAARKFPRVGPWADLFKQMLGFVLLAFTFFFAAGRFTTPAGQWWAAVPIAVMAAMYLMARTVQLSREARAVAISSVISVGIVTASVLVACRFSGVFDPPRPGAAGGSARGGVAWVAYSDEVVDAARKAGKTVLVKFTATWCLNCQLIEGNVFHDGAAIDALFKHDVVTVKADLTKEDAPGWPRLRELSASGGIPLTAIYAPGYDKPVQISSVYKTATLIKTLDQLAGAGTAAAAAR